MKLNADRLNNTHLSSIENDMSMVLLYGQDSGKISVILHRIKKHLSAGEINIVRLRYEQIVEDVSLLFNAINIESLFGDSTIAIVDNVPGTVDATVMDCIKKCNSTDATAIFVATELKATSNIRKLFEQDENKMSIACYKDDERAMASLVQNYFYQHSMKTEKDVAARLATLLPPNQMIMYNELRKIVTYKGEGGFITHDDISELILDQKDSSLSDISYAYAMQDKKLLIKMMDSSKSQHIVPILIIRSIMNYMDRIIGVIEEHMRSKSSIDVIVSELKPPVFFKDRDSMISVSKSLTHTQALALMEKIINIERRIKQHHHDANSMVSMMLYSI